MSVSSSVNKIIYNTDGVTTTFPYTFRILDDNELLVELKDNVTGVTTTVISGYSVTSENSPNGGNVVFDVAPATNKKVIFRRNLSFVQETEYTEYSSLSAVDLETNFDRLTMQLQQVKEIQDRSIRLDSSTDGEIANLGDLTANAGLSLRVNGSGTGFEFYSPASGGLGPPFDLIQLSGSTISITSANGSLTIQSNGTGQIILGQATSAGIRLAADQSILDSSQNEFLKWVKTASAVNEFTITNSATGNGPILSASGGDTNIDVRLQAKGTGKYILMGTATASAEIQLREDTDNGTNVVGLKAPTSISSDCVWTLPGADGSANQVIITNGSKVLSFATASSLFSGGVDPGITGGRLTVTNGVPVTTGNATSAVAGHIYYEPDRHNRIALYFGGSWNIYTFSALDLSGLSASTLYDIYAYYTGAAVAIESVAWTNDTTRATALTTQDGVQVKTGDITRKWLGSVRTHSDSRVQDTAVGGQGRWCFNWYNPVLRSFVTAENTASWNYSTATFRQANNAAANQFSYVLGKVRDRIRAEAKAYVSNNTSTARSVQIGIGVDSSTVNSASIYQPAHCTSSVYGLPSASISIEGTVGKHDLRWLESGNGTDTQTWNGNLASGLVGEIWA